MVDALITSHEHIVNQASTLSPLPGVLHQGLTAVAFLGLLSLVTSSALFIHLAYRLTTWKRRNQSRANQFIVLIFNLVLADIQQSVAFVLNAEWVRSNSITVLTNTCFAQGWFISTGDLASGVFTFAIAIHSFADIVLNYRLPHSLFLLTILSCWIFIYACAVIGVAMHPSDFYMRAGAWCWINTAYIQERLWLHYLWILISEFGTFIIYCLIFLILRRRVRSSFYSSTEMQLRASSAAKLIIAYPIVYVVCTLPLVIARLTLMAGGNVSFVELCVAGAMITSNGWLDVLLYSLTRRALLFGPDNLFLDENVNALETFGSGSNWRPDYVFGTTTTIQANPPHTKRSSSKIVGPGLGMARLQRHSKNESTEDLVFERRGGRGTSIVKTETVVEVNSEVLGPMEMQKVLLRSSSFCGGRRARGHHSEGDLTAIKSRSSLEIASESWSEEGGPELGEFLTEAVEEEGHDRDREKSSPAHERREGT